MLTFWLIALGMVLVAGAIVIVPLWRYHPKIDISRDTINTALFRERLAELDSERREGRISDQEYQSLRRELEHNLLGDVNQNTTQHSRESRLPLRLAAGVVALTIPLFALGYYYAASYRGEAQDWINTQERLQKIVAMAIQQPDALPDTALEDLPNFTRALQARLLKEGMDDPNGLFILGISYIQLQQPQLAALTLKKAYELQPQQPRIMLAYAQAIMMSNEGRLTHASAELLNRILQAHPHHQGALLLFGFGAFNAGDYKEAIRVWQSLLAMRDPQGDSAQLLRNSIAQAKQLLTQQKTEQDSAEQAAAQTETGSRIAVSVDLSPDLKAKLSPNDILFIFAKAASGPPMPLAAVRQPVRDFPVTVVLDDSQAVMPAMKLSNFQQVVVGARISKAGNVTAQPGDLQGISETLKLGKGTRSVALVIDHVVQ